MLSNKKFTPAQFDLLFKQLYFIYCDLDWIGWVLVSFYSAFGKSPCTYESCWKSIERTIVSKNRIKQLHTLLVLHLNRCLTTEYNETTAHFNGNFDTDNQIYVP
jgi:hypothetical protein